ncbi:MAG: diphosphomevalonate/mevalonate 3,5-bisphosphate decarboxylase family protein [Legionellaceae bacterium]
MSWFAQAPSNIALIKYMGKKTTGKNIPTNASLSYTLNHLVTQVTLEEYTGSVDRWEPLEKQGIIYHAFSEKSQERFLKHLARIKEFFNYKGVFRVQSGNNFPHSTGLASSASSFAALTRCAVMACSELTQAPEPSVEEQAHLSREGSGSSCRSFFSPWAIWDNKTVYSPDINLPLLEHQVILIQKEEKKVSSSEAHQRILTSPQVATRALRAEDNLRSLLHALHTHAWQDAYEICWREFQDMHALFHTADPSFSYMTQETTKALDLIQDYWKTTGDGPLVTMDAGPNIHLLYRPHQPRLHLRDYDVL